QVQQDSSILNVLPATVTALQAEPDGYTNVALLLCGTVPLLAHITQKSTHLLGLETGMQVYAQIKATAAL
ncbi:MAG: TOBE domain-containing protein, partial [Thiothrix sp.]